MKKDRYNNFFIKSKVWYETGKVVLGLIIPIQKNEAVHKILYGINKVRKVLNTWLTTISQRPGAANTSREKMQLASMFAVEYL
jgi:hypothetical protein